VLVRGLRGPANHDGGALAIGPDQRLYIGVGDTGCNSGNPPLPPRPPQLAPLPHSPLPPSLGPHFAPLPWTPSSRAPSPRVPLPSLG